MIRSRILALGVAVLLASSAAWASPDLALVLNGNDNTLSTTTLPGGPTTSAVATFPAFTGEGLMAGDRYYAVVSASDQVVVFDAASLMPLDTLETGAGTNPYACAVDDAGNVFVSLLLTNEVVRFNATGTETGRTAVGRSPQGILLHGGELWVANTGFRFTDFGYDPGTLFVLDPATLSVVDSAAVGTNPQWIDATGDEIHAICTGNYFSIFGEVHVVDAPTRSGLAVVPLGGSPGMVLLDGDLGYTADYSGGIYRYRVSDRVVLNDAGSAIDFGGAGYSRLAADGEGGLYVTLYADDLLVRLETTGYTVDAAFPTGDGPGSVVLRDSAPVPVTLLGYSVESAADGVTLTWSIADDRHVAGWFVERSVPGTDWEPLVQLSAGVRTYHDPSAPEERVSYRLGAVERDGTVTRFAERTVTATTLLAIRPLRNPVRGTLAYALTPGGTPARISLVDPRGRVVRLTESPGDGRLDVEGLAGGVYFLRVTRDGAVSSTRVVVLP